MVYGIVLPTDKAPISALFKRSQELGLESRPRRLVLLAAMQAGPNWMDYDIP